jgi:metallo-beta-lactamase class B
MRRMPRPARIVFPLIAVLACAAAAPAVAASTATVEAHVAAARAAAGADLDALVGLCKPASTKKPSAEESLAVLAAQIRRPAPPPGRAFDNLYFVGSAWVSAWALRTSAGFILIDALNNAAEARAVIEDGMRRLGFDPAEIRVVLVTHGHGDHYGGARSLVEKYSPRVVMSDSDWRMTETKLEFESPLWDAPPKRDLAVVDGEEVRLGDTTVTIHLTPGHTLGTISPSFEVRDASGVHRALLWGGTSFNFGRDLSRLDAYVASTERTAAVVERERIDVLLSNHPAFDDSIARLQRLRDVPGINPFVIGTPAVLRALTVMRECAEAQRDRYLSTP